MRALVLAVAGVGCSSGSTGEDMGVATPGSQPAVAGAAGGAASTAEDVAPAGAAGPGATTSGVATRASSGAATTPGVGAAATPPGAAMGDTGDMAVTKTTASAAAADLPPATGGPISEECRGFDFEGLVYSPGGDVLPNKCEAFHPTLNNPYAVRCVDVWPWYETQFPGDNFCILPPPPDKGIQFGHHIQGEGNAWFEAVSNGDMSAYENPPADWMLDPGGEEERNILIKHDNPAGKYYRIYSRMRGGSHHMIVSTSDGTGTFTWGPGGADGLFGGTGIPGAQRPDENAPQSLPVPEEDVGLYREVPAGATVQYNMHHFNSTDKAILKEAWQNLWWTDNPTTPVSGINGLSVLQAVGTFAQPGEIVDMHYATTAPEEVRVLGLFGHRHAWTTAFTAWVERASNGGEPEIVYQSFDWFDEPTYNYNSQVKNPVPMGETKTDGGFTGILKLDAGDKLHFNCHIEYTDERAIQENSPVMPAQNGPLRFANQAFNAEMCILFGAAVGNNGTPEQLGPPPDFARIR